MYVRWRCDQLFFIIFCMRVCLNNDKLSSGMVHDLCHQFRHHILSFRTTKGHTGITIHNAAINFSICTYASLNKCRCGYRFNKIEHIFILYSYRFELEIRIVIIGYNLVFLKPQRIGLWPFERVSSSEHATGKACTSQKLANHRSRALLTPISRYRSTPTLI